jgi:hypothetical protein
MTDIRFTQITATDCELTKTFSINEAGALESSAIAHMTAGRAQVVEIASISHLASLLPLLDANQAITCGVPNAGDTPLTTRAGAEFNPQAVARTNEAFTYPSGPALFPIDVDVDSAVFPTVHAVLDALEACSPWLKHVHRVARPSSSSFVHGRGLRGVHVYLGVTSGQDIPALGRRMKLEQWSAGRGFVKISRSGALLTRQLSDDLVYQPSRLMFESAPVTRGVARVVPPDQAFVERAPLVSIGRPVAYKTQDGLLDVQAMSPLRAIEERRVESAIRSARQSRKREAKKVALEYQLTNAVQAGIDAKEGERYGLLAIRALGDLRLPKSWTLVVKGVGPVTVADVLANIHSALGFQCADPFDTWRPDLSEKHFGKAEIVQQGDRYGVWSHKLQQFFEFTDDDAADLATPLAQAAEKLAGVLEYPEPSNKTAPFINIRFALQELLTEIECVPTQNVVTGRVENANELPAPGEMLDALSYVGCKNVSPDAIERAVRFIASAHPVDPWADAMRKLPVWDKTPRLDTVFTDICGALPSEALTLTGQLVFAAIVRKQFNPGAPCPVIPVLIGAQGTGKSQFVEAIPRTLGLPMPSSLAFGDDRRMSMAAARSIVAELAEMSGMGKREVEDIKRWTTDNTDAYRKPYETDEIERPRRFVLFGTANKHELNRDTSGNRRFMPVAVMFPIDPNWSVELPQILAEAKVRFADDEQAYISLVRAAPDAVKAYNDADMAQGVGMVYGDIDDLLPDALRAIIRRTGQRRLRASDIRSVLDQQPSGRQIRSRDVSRWLEMHRWSVGRTASMRFYEAPADFVDDDTKVVQLFNNNPFDKPLPLENMQ